MHVVLKDVYSAEMHTNKLADTAQISLLSVPSMTTLTKMNKSVVLMSFEDIKACAAKEVIKARGRKRGRKEAAEPEPERR